MDYLHRSGVCIGVVQHVECATTGTTQNHLVPSQDHKYDITGQNPSVDNVKTATRAHLLVLQHALELAHSTIKRGSPRGVRLQSVMVSSESSKSVQLVDYHIEQGPDSPQDVKSANDREMIRSVLLAVQKLSYLGLPTADTRRPLCLSRNASIPSPTYPA